MIKLYSKEKETSLIESMIKRSRLCHSFILTGDEGVGKKTLSKYIAMQILCESGSGVPCGKCRSCMMLSNDAHPDVITITPGGKSGNYRADDLRPIVSEASIAANEGGYKIYLLPNIDKALAAAQNTLLKIFEEPPNHVIFIMTASDREKVLGTILSRAVVINVTPASCEECVRALTDSGYDEKSANEAYNAFGGNIGMCLSFLSGKGSDIIEAAHAAADAIASRNEYALLKALSFTDRDKCLELLDRLSELVRDACVIKQGSTENTFFTKEAEKIASQKRLSSLMTAYKEINSAAIKLSGNANVTLTMNALAGKLI